MEELEGMNILDLVLVSEEEMRERTRQVGREGELSFRARHRRKDGTTFESEIRTRRVEVEGRELIVGIGKDITDQRLAEMLNSTLDWFSSSITSRLDFDEIMRSTVATSRSALGSDSAIIALRDGDAWTLTYEDGFARHFGTGSITSDQSAAARLVAQTGQTLLINDVRSDARMNQDFAQRFGIRSALVVPLKMKGETIGLLGFFCHHREGAFSDAHVDFANKLAYSISLLMENAKLSESEKAAEDFLRGVVETVPDAIVTFDHEGRFTFANKEAERLIGLPREEIIGRQHDDPRWRLRSMDGQEAKDTPFSMVRESKSPIHDVELMVRQASGRETAMSVNITPLIGPNGEVTGAIASLTDITARKRAQDVLKRRTRQLEVLIEVSNKVNSQLQTETVMRSLVKAAIELSGGTSGSSGRYVDGRMEFREYNEKGALRPIDLSFRAGYGVPGWVISTRKAYMTNAAAQDVHVVPYVRETLGFRNLIDVPIINAKGELLGCFEIHNKAGGQDFTEDDVAILEGLASSAAVALENARTLEEKARYEAALQKQKSDYQTVFESVPAMIAIKDTQGRVTMANHTFLDTFGLNEGNIGRWATSQNPETRERHVMEDREVIAQKAPKLGIVEEVQNGRGEHIWLRTDKMPYLDGQGNVVGVIMFSLDITEQKLAREQLVQEKENMSVLMETTPSGIILIDRLGRIAFANRSAEVILGRGRNEIIGRPYNNPEWTITDYGGMPFPPEGLPFPKAKAAGGPVFGIRHAIQRPDGMRTMLLVNVAPIFEDAGNFRGVIASLEDVTAQVETERALQLSLQTSDDIIQQIPSGILLFQYRDPDHLTLLSVNPTANILLGGLENQLGMDFDHIWKEGAFFATKEEFLDVVRGGSSLWREGVHYSDLTVDGIFTFRAFCLPCERLCVNFDDVTERMQEAELRRQAFAQIEKNIEHFATLVDRIRNPLSAITAHADSCGSATSERLLQRASEIDGILSQLDQGWLESEKVRDFLKKSL